jgi:photosystem II stability/assembly factor-like uncharacterized protein
VESVSLLGEADFHVLRVAGRKVYGVDSASGRLMVSDDAGRTWVRRMPPAGVFDVVIGPPDPEHVVASTERGVFRSRDAGESWRLLNDELAGLLAWPAEERLYLVTGQGRLLHSADGGDRFEPAGNLARSPVAFTARRDELYVAVADGSVQRSSDGGASWTVRASSMTAWTPA